MIFKPKPPAHSKNLFIHIGMPKTGSTAVQNFLTHNSERLEASGYLLPKLIHKPFLGHNSGNGIGALELLMKEPSILTEETREIIATSENLFWKISEEDYVEALSKVLNNRNIWIVLLVSPLEPWMSRWISHLISYHGIGKSEIDRNVSDTLVQMESAFGNLRKLSELPDVTVQLIPYDYGATDSVHCILEFFSLTELPLEPVPSSTFNNKSAHSFVVNAVSDLELSADLTNEDEANLKRLINAMSEVLRAREFPEFEQYLYGESSLAKIEAFKKRLKGILGRKLYKPVKRILSKRPDKVPSSKGKEPIDHTTGKTAILEVLRLIHKGTCPVVFDPEEYLRLNPDVIMEPVQHYFEYGMKEGRRIR